MRYNQLDVSGTILPKTEDGYKVKEDDLVWCVSDPFTITVVTKIHQDNEPLIFWLDPGDGQGDYPANNHAVFRYQRNCLLAARRIEIRDMRCSRNSIERTRGRISTIDKFLEELE